MLDDAAPGETAPDDEQQPLIWWPLTQRDAIATLVAGVALAVASFVRYGFGTHAIVGAIFCPALALLSTIDLRHRLLPDIIVGPAAIAIAVVVAVGGWHHLVVHLAVGAIGWGILMVLAIVRPGDMGWGDAKLVFLIGVALGSRTIAAMVFTSGVVIVLSLYLVVRYRRAGLKAKIAFGPLLALGALIAYFTG